MQATAGEFKNRAAIFGAIIGVSFALYSFDRQNCAAQLATWLAPKLAMDDTLLARILFAIAALALAAAAWLRTWASAYLNAGVVYASEVKSARLVADGPYRYVRNPLYLANVIMAVCMGAMMSIGGFVCCVTAMLLFTYRLIAREEGELRAAQGERYAAFCRLVPRLWPSLTARVPSGKRPPDWSAGFRAEAWYWGFAAAILSFAITLRIEVFFLVTSASIASLWLLPSRRGDKSS